MPIYLDFDTIKGEVQANSADHFDFAPAPEETEQTREHILLTTLTAEGGDNTMLPAVQKVREAARFAEEAEDAAAAKGDYIMGDIDLDGEVSFSDFVF